MWLGEGKGWRLHKWFHSFVSNSCEIPTLIVECPHCVLQRLLICSKLINVHCLTQLPGELKNGIILLRRKLKWTRSTRDSIQEQCKHIFISQSYLVKAPWPWKPIYSSIKAASQDCLFTWGSSRSVIHLWARAVKLNCKTDLKPGKGWTTAWFYFISE